MKSPSRVDRVEDAAAVRTELNQVVDVVEVAVAQLSAEPATYTIGQDLMVRFVVSASSRRMYIRLCMTQSMQALLQRTSGCRRSRQ